MARISAEIEIAAYDDASGVIRVSRNREDTTGEEYIAIKQGDELITLSPEAVCELQRALLRLQRATL